MPKRAPVLLLLAGCRALVQVQQLVISLARPASVFLLLCSAVYSNFAIVIYKGECSTCVSVPLKPMHSLLFWGKTVCCFQLSFNCFFRTSATVAYVPGCCSHISAYTHTSPTLKMHAVGSTEHRTVKTAVHFSCSQRVRSPLCGIVQSTKAMNGAVGPFPRPFRSQIVHRVFCCPLLQCKATTTSCPVKCAVTNRRL